MANCFEIRSMRGGVGSSPTLWCGFYDAKNRAGRDLGLSRLNSLSSDVGRLSWEIPSSTYSRLIKSKSQVTNAE